MTTHHSYEDDFMNSTALILGGGIFGLSSALELRTRGWQVTLLDAGSIPHPDAASTDINKVIRMDYASDDQYTAMGELSILRWHEGLAADRCRTARGSHHSCRSASIGSSWLARRAGK